MEGEQNIDLVTGPAVAVRAYLESFFLVRLTGDDKYLYPGFSDTVPKKWWPRESDTASDKPWIGTITNHLLSLTRTGSEVAAIGCMYTYRTASPHSEGEYEAHGVPVGAPEAGIAAFKVTVDVGAESTEPEPPQTGPARSPFENVFGNDQVTGYWGGYFGAETTNNWNWPERERATPECITKAPDPLERREYILGNYLAENEFPTLPVKPGWPEAPGS
ncbi:hypothetical protein A5740_20590 [Mycobacterium sp. GA-1841]|nr:hypothetical protein A5740_20590 [Mycobacterium sp. GA-1841]